ncbi:MAG: sulfatase [Verrucomicrobiota bacterium]
MKYSPFLALFLLAGTVFPAQRPNIVFAIADDWGFPHASIYENDEVLKTPVFDRLAREGILFNHAYISSPSCTPSRNAILTGQYHWRLGPGANLWSTLATEHQTYPLLLKAAGYHVGSWRKSWGPGRLTGWDDHPAGKPGKGFDDFIAKRPKGAPFCFWLGASDPHRGYKPGSGKNKGMDLSKITLPGCFPDSEAVRSDVADYYFEVERFDSDVGKMVAKREEMGELENTLILMTGDHGMPFPRCKGNIYDSGARVCLAARWGSKIKGGRVVDDFVSTTDFAPTFLEAAGVAVPQAMTGRSLMNVFSSPKSGQVDPARSYVLTGKERHTPCQDAGISGGTPMRAIRNTGFLFIVNDRPERWPAGTPHYRNAFMSGAWYGDCDNGPTKTYMVENAEKDAHHKKLFELAFGKRPRLELYDLKKDPDQLDNVAENPEYAGVMKKLAEQLHKDLVATGDPRELGQGDQFDSYPYFGGVPTFPGFKKK